MQGMMMQYSEERTANAVGGKTARACENCLRKRARWFCGADDAFLCQACDKSVHSANQLASRHERVRLETSSTSSSTTSSKPPVWHQGFTRKARTPRHNNKKKGIHVNSLPLVPEIGGEESCLDENEEEEEELLYRVPEFDLTGAKELNFLLDGGDDDDNIDIETCGMELISSHDAELAEFAADVESLLNDDDSNNNNKRSSVKIENDEEEDEPFSWDDYFDYSAASPAINNNNNNNGEDEDIKKEMMMMTTINGNLLETKEEAEEGGKMIARKISLKLNYEEVMNAWDNNSLQLHQAGCPWINGTRPDFDPSDNSWPDFLLLENGSGTYEQHPGAYGVGGGVCRNEEREARVSRYREKRRTRLFSKKIRYEVRKLNAEKRPRMKGRFVKRTTTPTTPSSSSSTFPNNNNNKNNYLPIKY